MAAAASKRRDVDVMKLMMSNYEVCLGENENPNNFYVKFHGPRDSAFEGGIYKIHVTLPAAYPYKSPSIGFCTTIFHPNIDERSGSVCLDVINQTWSPMFDLLNIFDAFLPQLLQYPNAADPLNGEAAAMSIRDPKGYLEKVREYVKKYASEDFQMGNSSRLLSMNGGRNSNSSSSSSSGSSGSSSAAASSSSAASLSPLSSLLHNGMPKSQSIRISQSNGRRRHPQHRLSWLQRQRRKRQRRLQAGPSSSSSSSSFEGGSNPMMQDDEFEETADHDFNHHRFSGVDWGNDDDFDDEDHYDDGDDPGDDPDALGPEEMFSDIEEEFFHSVDDDSLMMELSSSFHEQ